MENGSTKTLEALLAALPDVVLVFNRNGQFEFVGGDPDLLHARPQDAVGRRVEEVLPRELHALTREAIETVAATGETKTFEYPLEIPAGRRNFEARFSRMDRERVVCVSRDITERKQIEQSWRDSERKHRLLAENAQDIIFQTDPEQRVTYLSPAVSDILGYEAADLLGRSTVELYKPGEAERVGQIARTHLSEGSKQRVPIETVLLHKDSREVPIEILGRLIFDEDGTFIGTQGTLRDITERKRAERRRRELEARVQQSQKMESLGVLAGGIAHDFNNLLVGILGNVSLAEAILPPDSPIHALARDIEAAALRATELVRQVLAYSGRGQLAAEPIELGGMVEEVVHLLKPTLSGKATLDLTIEDGQPSVLGDGTQLRQVLMNLLTNASDALGEESGTISVTTGTAECDQAYLAGTYLDDNLPAGTYAYFEVADSGHGMEPSVLDKMFDPFFSSKAAGRGLGLAAVLGTVRGHKGAIAVRTRRGEGTVIRVLFPATAAVVSPDPAGRDSAWRGQGTVLMVDDEELVLRAAKRMVASLGFDVLTAADGQQAVEIFGQNRDEIRCVVLDLTMPKMDGEACYRALRGLSESVPVVLSSGFDEQELMERFQGQKLAGFIQKPYHLGQLTECLRQALVEGEEN